LVDRKQQLVAAVFVFTNGVKNMLMRPAEFTKAIPLPNFLSRAIIPLYHQPLPGVRPQALAYRALDGRMRFLCDSVAASGGGGPADGAAFHTAFQQDVESGLERHKITVTLSLSNGASRPQRHPERRVSTGSALRFSD
jgi:hypothetical protein